MRNTIGVLLLLFVNSAHSALIGASSNGNLYIISETTGASTYLSSPGVFGSLDYSSNGTLYGMSFGTDPALYSINAISGSTSLVGSLGFSFIFEGGLAIGPGDIAYGVNEGNAGVPGLFSVNLATGAATSIGIMSGGDHDINGLTVRSDGMLVGLDRVTSSLLAIDPVTASTSVIASLGFTVGVAGGMDSNGTTGYFANGSDLYSVDLYSGAVQSVGNMGVSIYGLAVTAVPIPAAVWLFGSGLGLLGWFRRKA
jgi:hypothetical protein